jgi:hypothetical protein
MLLNDTNHEDLTLSSRYECKYLISPLQTAELRQYIHPFVRPDPYAANWPGNRYPISSLYLDSDDLVLYQQTVGGEKNRFKLRARTYSDDPGDPVFLEVKRKVNNIVRKRRARVSRAEAHALLSHKACSTRANLSPKLAADVDFYEHHASLVQAKPIVRIKYVREAYESSGGDPVRVTLDTDLMHVQTLTPDLNHDSGRWISTPLGGVILEIKFTDNFPHWVNGLVQALGLKQQPVPKYVWSVDHMLTEGRETSLSIAGQVMPPRRA